MRARNPLGIGLSDMPAAAGLHRLAGRYDNSVPIRFLAPIDCSKIPALNLYIFQNSLQPHGQQGY
jgi:hypothetical protein